MPTLTSPAFVFAPGDTLRMPVTYRNPPAEGATLGDPIDLTGKEVSGLFYATGRDPIALTVANGGLTVDAPAGLMSFVVTDEVSAALTPDAPGAFPAILAEGYGYPAARGPLYPTRLRARVRDSDGDIGTIAIFPISLFDPATVDPATFPQMQAGTVVAGGGLTPDVVASLIAAAVAPLVTRIAAIEGHGGQ